MDIFHALHSLGSWALLILRIDMAASFWIHGVQKWKFWKMQPSDQLPASMIRNFRILSIAEPLGAIALLIGFLTQLAALGIAIIMIGAIYTKALKMHRTFPETGGWELDTVLLAGAIVLIVFGAGRISLDWVLFGL